MIKITIFALLFVLNLFAAITSPTIGWAVFSASIAGGLFIITIQEIIEEFV